MIMYQSPAGASSSAVISGTTAGHPEALGYQDPASAARPGLPAAPAGPAAGGYAGPKLLPDEPIGIPRPQQQKPTKASEFAKGAMSGRPAGSPAAGAAEVGAAEAGAGAAGAGAVEGALGAIARVLPALL
jgi:hypothetical protein